MLASGHLVSPSWSCLRVVLDADLQGKSMARLEAPHPTKRSTIDSVELVSVSTFWRGTFPVFRRSVTWRPGGLGMLRYCPVELQTSRPPDSTRGVDDRLWQLKLFSERSNVQVHPYVRTGLSFGELPHNSSRYMSVSYTHLTLPTKLEV